MDHIGYGLHWLKDLGPHWYWTDYVPMRAKNKFFKFLNNKHRNRKCRITKVFDFPVEYVREMGSRKSGLKKFFNTGEVSDWVLRKDPSGQ